jgi:glutamyl-tRNA reductase
VSFDELPEALLRADILVSATTSPHPLLEVREAAAVMRERAGRPMLLIDLAVPRDIDAACARLEGVSLSDIDDLQAVASRNRKVRQAEARKAEGIIEEEIQQFATWLGSLEVLPTLAALRAHATQIAEQVVSENAGKWESASPRDRERVDAVARAVVNRLLHEPTLRMKEMRDDRVHARMALVRDLFGISVAEGALGTYSGADLVDDESGEDLAEVRELRAPGRAANRRRT